MCCIRLRRFAINRVSMTTTVALHLCLVIIILDVIITRKHACINTKNPPHWGGFSVSDYHSPFMSSLMRRAMRRSNSPSAKPFQSGWDAKNL